MEAICIMGPIDKIVAELLDKRINNIMVLRWGWLSEIFADTY